MAQPVPIDGNGVAPSFFGMDTTVGFGGAAHGMTADELAVGVTTVVFSSTVVTVAWALACVAQPVPIAGTAADLGAAGVSVATVARVPWFQTDTVKETPGGSENGPLGSGNGPLGSGSGPFGSGFGGSGSDVTLMGLGAEGVVSTGVIG